MLIKNVDEIVGRKCKVLVKLSCVSYGSQEKKKIIGTGKIMFKINRRNSLSDRGRYL